MSVKLDYLRILINWYYPWLGWRLESESDVRVSHSVGHYSGYSDNTGADESRSQNSHMSLTPHSHCYDSHCAHHISPLSSVLSARLVFWLIIKLIYFLWDFVVKLNPLICLTFAGMTCYVFTVQSCLPLVTHLSTLCSVITVIIHNFTTVNQIITKANIPLVSGRNIIY